LGWIALLGCGDVLKQLVFGYRRREAAIGALDASLRQGAREGTWNDALRRQVEAYADGERIEFEDQPVDSGRLSKFHRRVMHHCRRIPYGSTMSYGRLAVRAGSPGAARAVGNCMAANRVPLIVPCHRVVAADGRVGSFSAPGGASMKRRLLALEGAATR
jgi:methylated-DNA-[protein]-cysteine S-methyltransferase